MTRKAHPKPANGSLSNQLAVVEQRLGPIQHRPIEGLRAYKNNPRKHSEKQIVQLMASVGRFGFTIPILIDEHGTIIAGEARAEAARRLGISKVPVLVADQWSPAQIKAYRLADNKLATNSTWDIKALAIEINAIMDLEEIQIESLGFDTAEIDVLLAEETSGQQHDDPADSIVPVP